MIHLAILIIATVIVGYVLFFIALMLFSGFIALTEMNTKPMTKEEKAKDDLKGYVIAGFCLLYIIVVSITQIDW